MVDATDGDALFGGHPELLAGLKARYGEASRKYHAWSHIEQLLDAFRGVADRIHHQDATLAAIYYHDAVYDVFSPTNEEDSADLLAAEMADILPPAELSLARRMVIATKRHEIDENFSPAEAEDCRMFLDMDMSILGAAPADYRAYADNIRKEYAAIDDALFLPGRKQLLEGFLQRDRLFLTDEFHDRLEAQARANIADEIARLSAAIDAA